MANYNGVIRIDVSWTKLKSVASLKNLAIQYDGSATEYDIFCIDGNIAYITAIFIGSVPDTTRFNQAQNDIDKSDFETNYKDITTNRSTTTAAAVDGYAINTTSPTLVAGSDGSFIRTLKADSSGRLITVGLGTAGTPTGGVLSIQGVSGGQAIPISGTVTATNPSVSTTATAPPSSATYVGGSVTTAAPSYTTGQMNALSLTTTGLLRIDGSGVTQPVSGTVTAAQATAANLNATVVQSTAANLRAQTASEATTATSTGTVANLAGGAVTTAAPTYTTGQMNPLSLTTAGALRIDGSSTTQPVSGTVTANIGTTNGLSLDATLAKLTIAQSAALGANTQAMIGGSVTTAAPTYTTGNINPLSLTTAGALRIDGSGSTQPVSGTVTANAGTGNFTVVQATAANLNATVTGTVTANIGTSGSLALDATLTGGTQRTKVTDGTNNAAVKAASTAAVAADPALVVAISPNNTVAVSGTVTATNPSVSTTGSTPPASATYVGGSVTTAAPTYTTGQMSALSLTTGGLLRIDGSGVTQPVSGTVTANAGTGNFTVVQATAANLNATVVGSGNFTVVQGTASNLRAQTSSESATGAAGPANTTYVGGAVTTAAPTYTTGQMDPLSLTTAGALRIDGSGTTQPVSGTVTSNIGTTNGLALDASVTGLVVAQASTTSGQKGMLTMGAVTTAAPAYTTAQTSPLSLTTTGLLRVDGSGATQPVSGTVTANQGGAPWSQNVTQFGGVNVSTGTGASGTGIPRVTVANDSNILATQSGTWTVQPGNTANTTPWLATVNQGGNSAAVKAASTAAVAADPALVVAISPNNSLTISAADVTGSGALGALNAAVQVSTTGLNTVGFQLAAGTLIGTIIPEISFDAGTTWNATYFDTPTAGKVSSIVFASSNTATAATIVGVGGSGLSRVRVSAYTSGTANITVRATTRFDPSTLFAGPAGSASPPDMALTGGLVTTAAPTYVTGTLNALSLTTAGALRVSGADTVKPLYGASGQTITVTLASLANAAARQSAVISNTTNLYEDVMLYIKITPAAAGVSTTGFVNVYAYGSVDGGTNYPEGITGSDAAYTVLGSTNLVLLAQINVVAVSTARSIGPISFCRTYGLDRLPASWGIVIQNETGAAFNATAGNFTVEYQGVNGQLV